VKTGQFHYPGVNDAQAALAQFAALTRNAAVGVAGLSRNAATGEAGLSNCFEPEARVEKRPLAGARAP